VPILTMYLVYKYPHCGIYNYYLLYFFLFFISHLFIIFRIIFRIPHTFFDKIKAAAKNFNKHLWASSIIVFGCDQLLCFLIFIYRV
jgi:hypothetical protein